jgi:hypothetical protein
MKKLIPLLLAAVLATPTAFLAATFEGKVAMKITGPREGPSQMTFSLKEGFTRIDVAAAKGPAAAMIFDQAKEQMTILMLEQKMFMIRPVPKPAATAATPAGDMGTVGVVKTGATENILGYDCVKYTSQSKDGTTETWVTDQLGAFMGMGAGGNSMGGMGGRRGPGAGAPPAQAWEQALTGKNMFPLRVVTTAGGKETFRMEATSVDKVALPASTFAPPADFRDIGEMMRGMGMPGGMPGMPGGMKPPGGG